MEAVGRTGDVEIEREVLADGEDIAQVLLQRIAGFGSLREAMQPYFGPTIRAQLSGLSLRLLQRLVPIQS